jgi:hypothetical protein
LARSVALAAALVAMAACGPICGIGASFSLTNALVDASYQCPYPADNQPYIVHALIDANNTTGSSVQIKSITQTWTNVAIHGNWSGVKGDHGTNDVASFRPKSVGAGTRATIKFSIPFQCTNSGASADTYGDFSFKFLVKTSSGTYTISSSNEHRLTFAAP